MVSRNAIPRSMFFIVPVLLASICLSLLLGGLKQAGGAQAAPVAPNQPEVDNVVTIGVLAALTQGVESIGVRQANAVQLAVDEINAAGGVDIDGTLYTVQLEKADSQCQRDVVDEAVNTLLDAGVVAVVGDTCSGSSFLAQELLDVAGVSMVSASSTSPQLTEKGLDNTFRVITRDDSWPRYAAESFYNTYAMRSASVIMLDDFWGNWTTNVFTDTFGTVLGGTITSVNTITSTDVFTDTLTQIQGEGAHVIYFPYDDSETAGLLAQTASNLGMVDIPIAWNSMSEAKSALLPGYDSVAGPAAEMNYSIFYYREPAEMPGYAEFNAAYVAANFPEYGDEAQMWGAFAYDAAKIILDAIDRADSTDPALIRDALAGTPGYEGVVGTYEGFDDKGDVIPQWGDMLRSLNGEWLSLYPDPATLPAYTYQMDDFNSPTLASEWSWVNEDPTHWSLTDNPGFLRITLQQTVQTNWLVQPAPTGDFDIQTHVMFNPTENFELAGLLLYQDDGTYLALGRAFCGFGYPGCVNGNGIYFDHLEGGGFISPNFAMRTPYEDHAYLRIIHEGVNYTAYVSEDGLDWWLVGRHVMGTKAALPLMGLATSTSGQEVAEIYADFDFFQVGPSTPITLRSLLPLLFKLPAP